MDAEERAKMRAIYDFENALEDLVYEKLIGKVTLEDLQKRHLDKYDITYDFKALEKKYPDQTYNAIKEEEANEIGVP